MIVLARVMKHQTIGDEVATWWGTQLPLAEELRTEFGDDFEQVSTTTFFRERVFTYQNEIYTQGGYYMESAGPVHIVSLRMKQGDLSELNTPTALFISESFANLLFEDEDPMEKTLTLGDGAEATIKGIYEDLPGNSEYADADFIGALDLYFTENAWMRTMRNPWGYSGFVTLVQLAPEVDFDRQNSKIKNVILDNVGHDKTAFEKKPVTFMHPMSKWRLYSRFENGINTGGDIETVQLYGLIGLMVLLLACINFMNLSTARSERRVREVGVRKAIGSSRRQLIYQFYCESLIVSGLAFVAAILLSIVFLPLV